MGTKMMMTSPMSDEMDAKDDNDDRYVDDVDRALDEGGLERFNILVYADFVPHQRIREVQVNIEGSARVDSNVLRTRQHL